MSTTTRVSRRAVAALALSLLVALAVPTAAFAATRTAPAAAAGVSAAAADDNIGGATYLETLDYTGAETVNDSLTDGSDYDDVFMVWLESGERLDVTLNVASSSNWGLYLYSPLAEDIFADAYLEPGSIKSVGEGGSGGSNLSTYIYAQYTGPYFVDVATYAGGGSSTYTLQTNINRKAVDVVLSSSAYTLNYGYYPTIKGTVTDRFGNAVAAGTTDLYFYYSFDGVSWIPDSGITYDGTQFTFYGFSQWRKMYYLVTSEGNSLYTTASQGTGAYGTRAKLSNVTSSKSTWTKGKSYTAYGYIEPKHTSGSYPVRIYKYKKVSGKWKSYGYVKAKASTVNDWKSKYSRSMSLPSAGSWRLRAVSPADSQHVKSYSSGYKYITVK